MYLCFSLFCSIVVFVINSDNSVSYGKNIMIS